MEESLDRADPADYMVVLAPEACMAPAQYSPLVLAYLGDSVYELLIRTRLVGAVNMQVNKLNRQGSRLAMARTQAAMANALYDMLTDDEKRLVNRGKNAKVVNIPKSCTAHEYHLATGFECLIGYLYLNRDFERIKWLTDTGWALLGKDLTDE